MAETVFEMMKASAAASIPQYRQGLTEIDVPVLTGMVASLRAGLAPAPERTFRFLDAVAACDHNSYQLLTQLETQDLVGLHEGIRNSWGQFQAEPQKQAIRHLYQLIAAHFFVYHVQS